MSHFTPINIDDTKIYPIGTIYKTRGKNPKYCMVVDILKTYDVLNNLVKIRYVSTHEFLGQNVFDYDVVATTIAMGILT